MADSVAEAVQLSRRATNGIQLHVAEAGSHDGPLVILLHGFPEYWRGWRQQIVPLAAAGFRLCVPDQRGYNLSDKPLGISPYDIDQLASDILGLADATGATRFSIVGHDWGASVGWWLATRWPARVSRLIALAAPHPVVWREAMRDDREQRRLSRYVQLIRLPWLPELLIRRHRYEALVHGFRGAESPDAFPADEIEQYRQAWSRPGSLTAMLNWYRAIWRKTFLASSDFRVRPPTLLVWGGHEIYAARSLAASSMALCDQGEVVFLEDATHWIQHDEPGRVNSLILEFLGRA